MSHEVQKKTGFTLVEILVATTLVAVLAGVGLVAITGVRENAREARLQNDVAVVNNAIDAYIAAGGVIPPGATADLLLAKLKTVASPDSTALGLPGPFIDQRLQLVVQSSDEAASDEARADFPNAAGYFFVRKGGEAGIKEFVTGSASPVVTEFRQGTMPYTPDDDYVMAYTDRPATSPSAAAIPLTVAGTDEAARQGKDLAKLARPDVQTRKSGSTNEWVFYAGQPLKVSTKDGGGEYPAEVRLFSPIWTSDTFFRYSINSGAEVDATNNPAVIASSMDPDDILTARVMSRSTNRYVNSDPRRVVFNSAPVDTPFTESGECPPALITYAEAGGLMVGSPQTNPAPVNVKLENIAYVPAEYRTSEYVQAYATVTKVQRYTGTTNVSTNSGFSAPTFTEFNVPITATNSGFGTATSIRVQARAETFDPRVVTVGDPIDCMVSILPTTLSNDILPLKPIGLPPAVTITHSGSEPVGMRKLYTLTAGSAGAAVLAPVAGGVATAAAITNTNSVAITNFPIDTYTVVAQATGPLGTEHWFTCTPVSRTYIAITTVPLKYIGLNMFRANINGYVKGSIYMQAGDFAILNAGATIEGNVYVPGLPGVVLPAGAAQGKTVARRKQAYDPARDVDIEATRITGNEYDTEGRLANPQADLRKIVDLYGSSTPDNYDVTINNTARIDGKLYRRANPPPISGTKPQLPPSIALSNASVNVTGTNTLASGSYAVTLANTNSVLRLGTPGNLTQYVFGSGSTWTAGRVEILGPVQIFLNANTSFNGVTFGNSNSIFQTGFVVMSNYSVSIDNLSAVYGQFEARDSAISIGSGGGSAIRGSFYGSAFASVINVDGSGYVDVSGGSDTNSVTPNPTPSPTPRPSPTPKPTPSPTP